MKKEVYERAEILVSVFREEDVVTASVVTDDPLGPDFSKDEDDLEILPFD